MAKKKTCAFLFADQTHCKEPVQGRSETCFFHNPKIKKTTRAARQRVIKALQQKKRLDGAQLAGIDLSYAEIPEARLVQAKLTRANLMRANIEKGHLFGADLKGADLFNTNLRRANIKETNLEGASLLETKFNGAKMMGIKWGKENLVVNEIEANKYQKANLTNKAADKYREAEEIYRNIRTALMGGGLFDDAAEFFYREMVNRRKQLPYFSFRRFSSKIIDLLCGYGEKTGRVISSALFVVLFNAMVYFCFGITDGVNIIGWSSLQPSLENTHQFFLSIYFSVVTFTTLGYGDMTPFGVTRVFATFEAFIGAFMIALFVLIFGRKMIR